MTQRLPESKALQVVIVDNHMIVREGLRLILEDQGDFAVIGTASDGSEALRLVEQARPHVVLMDLRSPGKDELSFIEQIRRRWPDVAVVILTTLDDDELMLAGLRAGASGYLLKDIDRATLFHALRTAARGEMLIRPDVIVKLLASIPVGGQRVFHGQTWPAGRTKLTDREHEVLTGVARGERNKEIAARLGIREPTVKSHLSSIYYKLHVDSRASAVAVAFEHGLLPLQKGIVCL